MQKNILQIAEGKMADASSSSGAGGGNPKISVVFPIYNAAKDLPACLDSLLAQSMGDFEIIGIDDASADNSWEIISAYAARDNRIRPPIRNEKNANSFETRRRAMERANGQYVIFCDADDIVPTDAFKLLLNKAEKTGADLVHGRMQLFYDQGRRITSYFTEPFRLAKGSSYILAMLRNRRGWSLCAKLFSRRTVEHALPLFPQGRHWFVLDDMLANCLLGLHVERYEALNAFVYNYRAPVVAPVIKSGGYDKWAMDSLDIMIFLEDTISGCPYPEPFLRGINGFMQDCITGLLTEQASSPEAFQRSVEKVASLPEKYVKWAEESGLPGFDQGKDASRTRRLLRKLWFAGKRIKERGLRESYLRYRIKHAYHWERKYLEAHATKRASSDKP